MVFSDLFSVFTEVEKSTLPTAVVDQLASLLFLLPCALVVMVILYYVMSLRAVAFTLLSLMSVSPVTFTDRPLARLMASSTALTLVNACIILPITISLFAVGTSEVPFDESMATTVGILSMVGIGLFLLPLLFPLYWLLLCALVLEYVISSGVALRLIFARRTNPMEHRQGVDMLGAHTGVLPVAPVGISARMVYRFIVPVLLAALSLLVLVHSLSDATLAAKLPGVMLVLVGLWGSYFTARTLFQRYTFFKALLLLILAIPVWFVGVAVVAGIIVGIFGLTP